MPSSTRPYDVLVWGATGFTGRYVCEYLAEHAPESVKWAIGGRSESLVKAVKDSLLSISPKCAEVGVLIGDGLSKTDLVRVLSQTRVVICMTGPFHRYASLVVETCIETKTDYCDITGEAPWIRDMINKYGKKAEEAGVLLVPFCGFDSIPSDLGVLLAHRHASEVLKRPLKDTTYFIKNLKGGFSGGTIETMFSFANDERASNSRLLVRDSSPLAVAPKRLVPQGLLPYFEPIIRKWNVPSVMGPINSAVVNWSASELGYGAQFNYGEYQSLKISHQLFAAAVAVSVSLTMAFVNLVVLKVGFFRSILRKSLPAPGQGPSREECVKGFFDVEILALTSKDHLPDPEYCSNLGVRVKVALSKDPGYSGTALMVAESGLFLALNRTKANKKGGIWSPAVGLGYSLVERLRKAGMKFDVSRFEY